MKKTNNITLTVIAMLLTALFSYTTLSKMIDYPLFTKQLRNSPLLGALSGVLAWLIPVVELCAVILLIVPAWRRTGLLLSAVLMLTFTVYIGGMLLFFETLPCSCGGVFEQMTWTQHLLFNIVFSLLALAGFILHKPNNILSR
ncbi:MauE/DoxX family redox-associated membrane protein [Chryseosolibacter indicus]|uniref:Methylamine utilisation protein MauE domain-containing protein n=1 Tax=Chryseosolibacter indicus TaxID=2782351 RepID=A0ABS5VV28_9BACT|nr:MauE/DoxX family redox-associated membrane protein [Chryseosolibacter indicus]MBT1704903.1 hypothetical protein [Chryseosolibacter indicus]